MTETKKRNDNSRVYALCQFSEKESNYMYMWYVNCQVQKRYVPFIPIRLEAFSSFSTKLVRF